MSDKETGEPGMKENSALLVAYLFSVLGGLIVYFAMAKGNKNLKFHAMQSILLGVAMFIVSVVVGIIIPFLSSIVSLAWTVGCIALGVLAFRGKTFELPVIAGMAHSIADK